jgi:hypothetical protein
MRTEFLARNSEKVPDEMQADSRLGRSVHEARRTRRLVGTPPPPPGITSFFVRIVQRNDRFVQLSLFQTSMRNSPFFKVFEEEAVTWEDKLNRMVCVKRVRCDALLQRRAQRVCSRACVL